MVSLACIGMARGIPFVKITHRWAIGIYAGRSALDFYSPRDVRNPVLKAEDVTDVPAVFVADPFMVRRDGKWYMFFEVLNSRTNQGDIGWASSNDGKSWHYEKIVLDEPFHLSYPYVFEWQNRFYMIPETYEANSVRLYEAVEFPARWKLKAVLLSGGMYVDSSVCHFNGRWWMFTTFGNGELMLFYAENLIGPWTSHPMNPILQDNKKITRPAGRVLIHEGKIYRYAQDDATAYGVRVHVFEITELSVKTYREKMIKKPVLERRGFGWSGEKMHHIDPHPVGGNQWLACVDGSGQKWLYGWEY